MKKAVEVSSQSIWEKQADQFIVDLKRRHIIGSFNTAKQTAELIRTVVSSSKWANAKILIEVIKNVGKKLIQAQPLDVSLRGEPTPDRDDGPPRLDRAPSLYNMLGSDEKVEEFTESIRELKASIIEGINELIDELKNLYRNIAEQATEHIHSNEVIMTFGHSQTVAEFLKAAARKRKFEVVVAESGPSLVGHKAALELSQAGISTTLIPDAAIFSMMARVNKVIITTHAVMANGGLVAITGAHMLAVAAKHHSVPLMVCTGLYKLSPLYPYDQDTFNDCISPGSVIRFENADELSDVHIDCPAYDYIPPELVDLFVTNFGGHNPSYIYRLLVEYYNPEDTLDDQQ